MREQRRRTGTPGPRVIGIDDDNRGGFAHAQRPAPADIAACTLQAEAPGGVKQRGVSRRGGLKPGVH